MNNNIKITTWVKVEINGQSFDLTQHEATNLYNQLDSALNISNYSTPYYPYNPYYPRLKTTDSTQWWNTPSSVVTDDYTIKFNC